MKYIIPILIVLAGVAGYFLYQPHIQMNLGSSQIAIQQIRTTEMRPATSTSMVYNWASSTPQTLYQMGTAAYTLYLINATTSAQSGTRRVIILCNPGSTGGVATIVGVEFISTYTQTTTANQCDVLSLMNTLATSTSVYKIAGTAGTGFQ